MRVCWIGCQLREGQIVSESQLDLDPWLHEDLDPACVVEVSAVPDDTPSDMDDSISVSIAYLDLLIRRSQSVHCRTCTCK